MFIWQQVYEPTKQIAHEGCQYSKTCLKQPLKKQQNKNLYNEWQLNEGQKDCRMLSLEHSAILLTCIKKYLVFFFEWPLKTGFTL